MRMEQFTQIKMERVKAAGAEILQASVDVQSIMTPRREREAREREEAAAASAAAAPGGVAAPPSASATTAASPAPAAPETAASPSSQGDGVLYQPKVSTWGAFPRPSNISEAYGGGRNIVPGQPLETKEQAEAREAALKAAMAAYKKKVGANPCEGGVKKV